MKRTPALVLALSLALLTGVPAAAQHSESHRAAAIELLEATRISETLKSSINTMMEVQLRGNPQLRAVEGVMRTFLDKYLSWENLKDEYAEIYAGHFTEDELRELTAFYRTPAGQKLASATPALMTEGARLGERVVQEHSAELQQMIMEHLQAPARQ